MILRHYKKPEMLSSIMTTFFVNMLPIVVLLWGASSLYFFHMLSQQPTQQESELITSREIWVLLIGAIAFVILAIIPFRTM